MLDVTAKHPKPLKANMSLKLDLEQKEELKRLAKIQNRSIHFLMLDMIEKGIKQAKEEEQYQDYIKERVLNAYQDMNENGSTGLTSKGAKNAIMDRVQARIKTDE